MNKISPTLGPPLMVNRTHLAAARTLPAPIIFVCMTNILLITSLISILSNSLTQASTSKKLTLFWPPMNLLQLIFLRPLRLFVSSDQLRGARIVLLKATHYPFVAMIRLVERTQQHVAAGRAGEASSRYQSSRPAASSSKRPASANRSRARATPRGSPPSPAPRNETTLDGDRPPDKSGDRDPPSQRTPTVDGAADVQDQIRQLSLQIEELTAAITQQAHQQQPQPT
ncbi:MAG: hypothetical protein M1837_007468 [Sclerophora amabilis]|nr:MAG: hypothetical protein M1837_007468 [Sclerophora amabilis]